MNNKNICPIDKPKKFKGGLVGLVGGLIASLCCITPVVLIFLGLGSVSFAFSFIAFKPYFLLASVLFLIITFFIYIKRKKCSVRSALKSRFIWTALLAYIVLFIGSIYFLVPAVGSYVFEKKLFSEARGGNPSCNLTLDISSKNLDALTCESCDAALKYSLELNRGVVSTEVDLYNSNVSIYYDKDQITSEEIIASIPPSYVISGSDSRCI